MPITGNAPNTSLIPAPFVATLQSRHRADLLFAGQLTGVEGYIGNIATGLLAGQNLARLLSGKSPHQLPQTTMLGALCHYITHAKPKDFQPMKANFGILPPLELSGKKKRGNEKEPPYAPNAPCEI